MAIDHFLPRVAATASGLSSRCRLHWGHWVARRRLFVTRARCCVLRGTSKLLRHSQHELMQLYGPNMMCPRKI